MGCGVLYDVVALLVLLLVLARFLDRNKRRDRYVLLAAVGLFIGSNPLACSKTLSWPRKSARVIA
jgi:hypothetical protein